MYSSIKRVLHSLQCRKKKVSNIITQHSILNVWFVFFWGGADASTTEEMYRFSGSCQLLSELCFRVCIISSHHLHVGRLLGNALCQLRRQLDLLGKWQLGDRCHEMRHRQHGRLDERVQMYVDAHPHQHLTIHAIRHAAMARDDVVKVL